jgi:hypothetical protein
VKRTPLLSFPLSLFLSLFFSSQEGHLCILMGPVPMSLLTGTSLASLSVPVVPLGAAHATLLGADLQCQYLI